MQGFWRWFAGALLFLTIALPAWAEQANVPEQIHVLTQAQALAGSFTAEGAATHEASPAAVAIAARLAQLSLLRHGEPSGASSNKQLARRLSPRVSSSSTIARSVQRKSIAAAAFSSTTKPTYDAVRTLTELSQRLQKPVAAVMSDRGTPRQVKVAGSVRQEVQSNAETPHQPVQIARAFLRENAGLLRIDDPDVELSLIGNEVDELGRRHLRFAQQYRGIPVWASGLTVHLDLDGNVDLTDGAFIVSPKKLSTAPVIDAQVAMSMAKAVIDRGEQATVPRLPSLVVYAGKDQQPRLAWCMTLIVDFTHRWLVIIDATSGAALNFYNEVETANVAGSGVDSFGINRNLNVWGQGSTFFMVDTSKQMFDPTSAPPGPTTTRGGIVVQDAGHLPQNPDQQPIPQHDVTSSSATSGWLKDAVSAAYGFSQTYDYFLQRHARNGLNGKGSTISATVRVGQNYKNAFFLVDLQAMFFGDADFYAGALDVVGHELSHGVIATTSNLVYQDQPGALNESFADIFGTAVQARTNGGVDWIMGDQLVAPVRNLADPSSLLFAPGRPYPAKMSQFVVTTGDNGGVHINSSIINHAFYELVEGLPGAIGILDAEKIFYRAATIHLQRQSQFIDARLACIQSAEELFGVGSNQALKVAQAFDAVEVFDAPSTPGPTPFPKVEGPDAVIAVGLVNSQHVLVRREQALGDGANGVVLPAQSVGGRNRPAVLGNGRGMFYVNASDDLCALATDGQTAERCLGFPGQVHSVTVSPDGALLAFVLLDGAGNPDNHINVVDVATGQVRPFTLVAPAIDGVSHDSIQSADAMDFTSDRQLLIYDALNVITFADNSQIGLWSIYAIDLVTGNTIMLIPPTPGFDIGFPTVSQTSDNFIVFDAFKKETGQSVVIAANLNTGKLAGIGLVTNGFGVPGYTGDDAAIVYSQFDAAQPIQYSLVRQTVANDHITPQGAPTLFLSDVDFGVVYRRGAFSGAVDVDLAVTQNDSADPTFVGQPFSYTLTVTNNGEDPATGVTLTDTLPSGVNLGSTNSSQGNCSNSGSKVTCNLGTLAGAASATVSLSVTPTAAGSLTNAANVIAAESDKNSNDNTRFETTTVRSSTSAAAPAAAVLPGSRSVRVGSTATAFATIINVDSNSADQCSIAPATSVAATFFYQTTDPATNGLIGTPNSPVNLVGNGYQTFVFGFTPTTAFAPVDVNLSFDCTNTPAATFISGVNTFLLSASNTPVPDIVALGATVSGDGILNIPGATGSAAFAVASVNVGASASITVSADTGLANLNLKLSLCQSNPVNAQCLAPPTDTVTTNILTNGTPTFSIFVTGTGNVIV